MHVRSRACTPTRVPSSCDGKNRAELARTSICFALYTLPISVRYRTGRAGDIR